MTALYDQTETNFSAYECGYLVDLADWIGEKFSKEHVQNGKVAELANILIDRDGEFLGCSKFGDSIANKSGGRQGVQQWKSQNVLKSQEELIVPERVVLNHKDKTVLVQCMFVEVKSANDRLDNRQEDWLNILDGAGYARVCKFKSQVKKGRRP